jgi:hypothetical protein
VGSQSGLADAASTADKLSGGVALPVSEVRAGVTWWTGLESTGQLGVTLSPIGWVVVAVPWA